MNIPVFMTVMLNKEKGSPYVAFGMACDFDVAKAIRKSVLESLHNEPEYQHLVALFEEDMERQREKAYELLGRAQ